SPGRNALERSRSPPFASLTSAVVEPGLGTVGPPAHGFARLTSYSADHPPAVDLGLVMRHARAMTRRSAVAVPADLRARPEAARLDLLALFRALDRIDLTPSEIP